MSINKSKYAARFFRLQINYYIMAVVYLGNTIKRITTGMLFQ